MKKLLLILTVVFVSVTSVFAGLNPYAYDLKSEWFPQTQILRVHFTLNDHPNTDQKIVNGKPTNETGIQIFALDRNNKSKLYCIYMVPAADIIAHINENDFQYDIDIPINGRDLVTGEALPIDKDLTFAVRVQGLNSQNKSTPSDPIYASDEYRPYSCHGVAVNNYQDSPDFGAVFVTEAAKDDQLSGIWSWLRGKGKALLHYSPRMVYKASYKKTSSFSDRTNTTLEPHRVCVSDDGRIFITSYNRYDSGNKAIVWEYKNGEFIEVIKHNNNGGKRGAYGHRVCGMDVKGSGENLRILLCFLEESDGQDPTVLANWTNSFRVHEYDLNKLGTNKNEGTQIFRYKPTGNTNAVTKTNNGYVANSVQAALNLARYYKWYCYTDGFADIAYAGTNKNDIVLSVDFYNGNVYNTYMVYHKNGTGNEAYVGPQIMNKQDHYYGGGGLLVYKDGSTEYAVSGRAQYGEYNAGGTNIEGSGRIHFYSLSGQSISNSATTAYSVSDLKTKKIINDMAMDCANNIYAVSFADGSQGSGRLLAFAMPYSGTTTTIAPNISTTQTFNLPPVPNILATDLCVTPHDKQAKYIFSFNVNTKPEGAEIRFYTTEAAMLADTKDNEAYIKYDNHDNCAYYYRFPTGACKQGTMSVELGILGHPANEKSLSTDMKLPAGKLYWNVYLKTRKSNAFAPIYLQPNTGEDLHYRLHATIDNNPDNDGFGHIYAIDYKREHTDVNAIDNPCALMVYSIGDANVDDNNPSQLSSSTRYALVQKLSANDMAQPRRPAVAPDGMVYLTDYGDYRYAGVNFNSTGKGPCEFKLGGIWVFNPNDPHKDADKTAAKLSRFYEEDETVSDACFYDNGSILKLYKTNTYEEFNHHGEGKVDSTYGAVRWMNNGFRIYTIGYNQDGTINHQTTYDAVQVIPFKVKKENGDWVGGDANGSMSVRATSDGVWFCQNRKGDASATIKPDNLQNVVLMFYNNSGERKFQSYTYDGGNLTQYTTSVLQSTPGAGMTISPDEKYLYVVNHEGNILEFEIGGSPSTGKTLTLKNKFINSTDYKCISTMNFDYAGNLVVTTDHSYPAYLDEKTQIVVFTMPYNRDNARTIPAPKSQREIPERLAYNDEKINTETTIAKKPALVDLYRPMPNTSYSTICLPFDLNLVNLADGHPYKTADIRAFEGAELSAVVGEKILYLNFSADPVTSLSANTPYIIQPSVRILNLVQLPATHWNTDAAPSGPYAFGNNNSITFTGVIPKQDIVVEPGKTLILVAENRLAEMEPDDNATNMGEILGFRGYFTLGEPLPKGMQAILRNKDNTVTGLVDINGKKVNINKYLREGRVYIRVGDTLYTIDGQKVK